MARPVRGKVITHQRADGLTTYMVRITAYGERQLIVLGNEADGMTPALAERRRHQIAEQIKAGVWQPPEKVTEQAPPQRTEAPTFREVATAFLRRKSLVVEANTRADLRWRLTHHLLPFFGDRPVSAIDNDAVFDYLDDRLQQRERVLNARAAGTPLVDAEGVLLRPLANTSINMTLATLAAVLDEPECEPWVQRNPARGKDKRLKIYREKGNFLEVDELNALLAAAERLDRRIGPAEIRAQRARELRDAGRTLREVADELSVAISTAHYYLSRRPEPGASAPPRRLAVVTMLGLAGPRATEASRLERRHVDLDRAQLTIADSKTATGVRVVNLSARAVAILTRVYATLPIPPDGPALPTANGTHRDKDNIGRLLDTVVAEANREREAGGLPPLPPRVTPHTLRRTYITLLLEAGAPLPYVMAQVGHKDEKTVLGIYARVLQRQNRDAIGTAFDALLG